MSRRFPPPWTVDETEPCFIVREQDGQTLAYAYCESDPGRQAAANLLTRDEARRIAANIAKLPGVAAEKVAQALPRGANDAGLDTTPRGSAARSGLSPSKGLPNSAVHIGRKV